MAENSKKKTGIKRKLAFPIGLLVTILALIGLVTVIVAIVNSITAAVNNSKHYEEYERILAPVVLIDPDTFDDITKADMSQLLEMSIWTLLKNDNAPDKYEMNENGLSIPKADVETVFTDLFGTQLKPIHSTIEGYGIDFVYDNSTECYSVPLTGVTPIYTPDVVEVQKSSDTVVLTVACLAGSAWEQNENGEMVAPAPDKYLKVTLREANENLFISAIQNTTTPEAVTNAPTEPKPTENIGISGNEEASKPTPTEPGSESSGETA